MYLTNFIHIYTVNKLHSNANVLRLGVIILKYFEVEILL